MMAMSSQCRVLFRTSTLWKCLATKTTPRMSSSSSSSTSSDVSTEMTEKTSAPVQKVMSSAMKSYLKKRRVHDAFIAQERTQFEIGKKRLAEMMGFPPDQEMTQDLIDQSIEYLFPSGLMDPKARPIMKPPEEVFPKEKDAEFDYEGRPFHPFFYTQTPHFTQTMYDLVENLEMLNFLHDRLTRQAKAPDQEQVLDARSFAGSRWMEQKELKELFMENIRRPRYEEFIATLERLVAHPLSYKVKDFIFKFRIQIDEGIDRSDKFIAPQFDERGRAFVEAIGQRKSSVAKVRVTKPGTGEFTIRHIDYMDQPMGIDYFYNYNDRHQIMYPLQFTRLLGSVDIDVIVDAGGPSSQCGAIRYAISSCLRSFVEAEMIDDMKVAGLLTQNVRVPERKMPGREKARRRYTWKKR